MPYVSFSETPIPELSFSRPNEVSARFLAVVRTELPGCVIRAANIDSVENFLRLQEVMELAVTFEVRDERFYFNLSNEEQRSGELGLHIDPNSKPAGATLVDLYTMEAGTLAVRLFRFQPAISARIESGASYAENFDNPDQSHHYQRNEVDSNLLVPEAHTASLEPGDYLVFTPGLHAHDFRSTGVPRRSSADFYNVTPRTV